jgi:hypothetical protein
MSKLVKIKAFLNPADTEQIAALSVFLSAIGQPSKKTVNLEPTIVLEKEIFVAEVVKEQKAEPKKRAKKAEFNNPEKENSAVDAYEATVKDKIEPIKVNYIKVEEPEILGRLKTLIEVRALLAEKRENNMPALRTKLAEIGTTSVTLMDPKDYNMFFEFMETLD